MTANVRILYDRRGTATDTRAAAVVVEIALNGKRRWLPTGISVTRKQWNVKKQQVVNRHDSDILNNAILRKYDDILRLINRAGSRFTLDMIDDDGDYKEQSFIDWMRQYCDKRTDVTDTTKARHQYVIRDMMEFGKITEFADVTVANVLEYQQHLHNKGISQTAIYNYEKTLRSYIKIAQRLSLIPMDGNPYDRVKADKGKSQKRRYLEMNQLRRIQNYQTDDIVMNNTRDLFLFQAYTGLAYADLAALSPERIVERGNDHYIIEDRCKTKETYYIKLIPQALQILGRHGQRLPVISNEKYNANLKLLAALTGIGVRLTSHMARHTFAVLALNNGVAIETLARILGHNDIRTTQIYGKIVQRSIDTAFDNISAIIDET